VGRGALAVWSRGGWCGIAEMPKEKRLRSVCLVRILGNVSGLERPTMQPFTTNHSPLSMRTDITRHQYELLSLISRLTSFEGESPTIQELAQWSSLRWVSAVHRTIGELCAKGMVTRGEPRGRHKRSIHVTDKGKWVLTDRYQKQMQLLKMASGLGRIPVRNDSGKD
jgi:predicted transcriptional regulator